MSNTKAYVNYLTLERSINKCNLKEALTGNKLTTVPSMKDFMSGMTIESLSPKDAERDQYSIPVYVYAIIVSDKDTLYFIDEYQCKFVDRVSFIGNQLRLLDNYRKYIYSSEETVQKYLREEFVGSFLYQRKNLDSFNLNYKEWSYNYDINTFGMESLLSLNYQFSFKYIKYNSIYTENPGLYIFTSIPYQCTNSSIPLIRYNRYTHNILLRDKERDRWNEADAKRLLKMDSESDVRIQLFNVIDAIFNSIS